MFLLLPSTIRPGNCNPVQFHPEQVYSGKQRTAKFMRPTNNPMSPVPHYITKHEIYMICINPSFRGSIHNWATGCRDTLLKYHPPRNIILHLLVQDGRLLLGGQLLELHGPSPGP